MTRTVLDLDRELPLIAAGDASAFARWLAGAEHTLRGGLRSFAAEVDTEAVLQEALLRVWQVAGRVEPDGKPNALLRFASRVARNLALSQLRSRSPAPGEEIPVEPLEPDPLLARAARACVEALPPKPRSAFLARMAGGGEDGQLAERLRMKLNTFLQNVTRARKLLTRCLASKGIDLEASP